MNASLIGILHELRYDVRNFKEEIPGKKYRFSCEVCGDSVKDKRKARFGVKIEGSSGVVNCFNCGYSNSFIGYLKHFHPRFYERLSMDKFKESMPSLFDVNSIVKQNISDHVRKKLFSPEIIGKYKQQLTDDSLQLIKESYVNSSKHSD